MKKVKLLITAMFMAVSLGIPANAVFAAGGILTQSLFDAADCTTEDTTPEGITCLESEGYYTLEPGTYTLGEDVTLQDEYFLSLSDDGDYTIDLGGHTLKTTGDGNIVIVAENSGNNLAIANGSLVAGGDDGWGIEVAGVTATLSNLTISAGEYAITAADGINDIPAVVTLTNIAATGTLGVGETSTLIINSGTYVSPSDIAAINMPYGGNLVIKGGSFTGLLTGLYVGEGSNVSLSGGTFTAQVDDESAGAIIMTSVSKETALSTLLASGYQYTDGTAAMVTAMGAVDVARLTNPSVSVVPITEAATEEAKTVGAPDSGFATSDNGSATASMIAASSVATAVVTGMYLSKKHFAKKNA